MKTYKMKRVVVGIMLVMLTLGFCVVGTGAALPDPMGGRGGQMGQGIPMDGQDFDGETPPEIPEGDAALDGGSFPGGFGQKRDFGQGMGADFNGQFSHDGGFGPGGQRDFCGHGGFGRDGSSHRMDNDVLKAIDALEDGETKTNLETLMDNVHTAMEALRDADDASREAAEAAVNEARDALHEALAAAGIDVSMNEAPERPEIDNGTRPELPENGNQNRPENGGRQNIPAFLNRENLESIDLNDEAQVQTLFQQFVSWLKGSNT